jgi:predicted ATPase
MALAYRNLSYVRLLRREVDEGRRWAEKQVEISKKYGLLLKGGFQLGWALAQQGHVMQGIEKMRNGITGIRASGAKIELPFHLSLLAHAYLDSGELRQAAATLDDALSVAAKGALFFFQSFCAPRGSYY